MLSKKDSILFLIFLVLVVAFRFFPDNLGGGAVVGQKLMIFGLFAVGFNILFGLTGYLSFGHAAFIGIGSYAAAWSMKLLTLNPVMSVVAAGLIVAVFATVIGYICLKRSGIYFSILTLAFAYMMYNLAYSVLTPITGGETSLALANDDPRFLDSLFGTVASGTPVPNFFSIDIKGWAAYWFCAVFLVIGFYISIRIFRSPFGTMLRGIKSNQVRMQYTGLNTKPYLLSAFIISGIYAGIAGALMVATNPFAGADRMFWTASGEVVVMTILGGVGTLVGPLLGSSVIEYLKINVSTINDSALASSLNWLPDFLEPGANFLFGLFTGDGWLLLLGVVFLLVIVFLPGGMVEGFQRLGGMFSRKKKADDADATPAE